jgi:hypothetical protein
VKLAIVIVSILALVCLAIAVWLGVEAGHASDEIVGIALLYVAAIPFGAGAVLALWAEATAVVASSTARQWVWLAGGLAPVFLMLLLVALSVLAPDSIASLSPVHNPDDPAYLDQVDDVGLLVLATPLVPLVTLIYAVVALVRRKRL